MHSATIWSCFLHKKTDSYHRFLYTLRCMLLMPSSWLARKGSLFYSPEETERSLQDLTWTLWQPSEILSQNHWEALMIYSLNWQTELENLPKINYVAQTLPWAIGVNEFYILILATTQYFTSSQEQHTYKKHNHCRRVKGYDRYSLLKQGFTSKAKFREIYTADCCLSPVPSASLSGMLNSHTNEKFCMHLTWQPYV